MRKNNNFLLKGFNLLLMVIIIGCFINASKVIFDTYVHIIKLKSKSKNVY